MFNQGSPSGGVYYLNDEPETFFAPMMNEIGTYTLRYEYVNSNGCSSSAEITFELLDQTTSLNDAASKSFVITPNPIRQGEKALLTYDSSVYSEGDIRVEVFNSLGKLIQVFIPNSNPIEIENLPSGGLYFIQISTVEKQVYKGKLLVL